MADPKRYPHHPARRLERHGSDEFWWYADGPVEVLVGGTWVTAEEGTDPNGVAGYSVHLSGPEAGAISGAHQLPLLGKIALVSRPTGDPKPSAVDYIDVY